MRLTRRRFLGQAVALAAAPVLGEGAILAREDDAAANRGPLPAATPARPLYPPLPAGARPFAPGERLRYTVSFEGIAAGEATLAVVGPTAIGEQSGLLVRYTAESRGLVAAFYHLHDRVEALLDPLFLFTRRAESWLEQGRRRRHRIVTFEPDVGRIVRTEVPGDTTTGPLDGHAVEGLGLIYHLRVKPLEPGGRMSVPLYRNEDVRLVTLGTTGPIATETPLGRFDSIEVGPAGQASGAASRDGSSGGGLFGGTLSIWFTTDARRIPVRLAGSGRRGSIDARLAGIDVPAPGQAG